MQLDAVEAGFASASRPVGKILDRLPDLVASHRLTQETHKGLGSACGTEGLPHLILDPAHVLLAA
jgi:hypothetical protein